MTNIQLELAVKELQKQVAQMERDIQTIRAACSAAVAADLRRLEEVTKKTFSSAGFGTDWRHAQSNYNAATPQGAPQ